MSLGAFVSASPSSAAMCRPVRVLPTLRAAPVRLVPACAVPFGSTAGSRDPARSRHRATQLFRPPQVPQARLLRTDGDEYLPRTPLPITAPGCADGKRGRPRRASLPIAAWSCSCGVGAKLGAICDRMAWTPADAGGLGGLSPAGQIDIGGRPRTPLGDLRIRRLGVRVSPGVPPKPLRMKLSHEYRKERVALGRAARDHGVGSMCITAQPSCVGTLSWSASTKVSRALQHRRCSAWRA